MSNAGRYGVNIGMGAASGAAAGTAAFPGIGTAIGGALGALGGGLSTLFQTSEEAKDKEKARQAYLQKQQENAGDDWERRYAAITGISNDPMYMAMSYKPYDAEKANADFDAAMPDDPPPNIGGLVSSLGQLGSTVGAASRQSAMQDQLGVAQINATKNPWQAFAGDPEDPMQKLLDQQRQAAWNRTGGW